MDRVVAFVSNYLPIIRALANIDPNILVRGSGRWPDPALANLVAGLEPIWRQVTGRTAALVSDDETGDLKACPFAAWLGDQLEKVGLSRPPVGRVVDVVRDENKKIRHPSQE